MPIRAAAALASFVLLSAFIMQAPQPTDPFFLPDIGPQLTATGSTNYDGNRSFRDTSAKTLRSNQAASAYSSCPVLVMAGQSNDENEAPTNYTPTNASNLHNFNPFDGAIYAGLDPLLGATGLSKSTLGHYGTRLADDIINSGAASCVVLAPIAIGGTKIADWAPGGLAYPRLKNAVNRLNARGFTTQYVLWGQGESDCAAGTTQSNYVASGNALFGDLPSSVAKIFVAEQSWDVGSVCAQIQNAQTSLSTASPAGLINHSALRPIWAGPNTDSLNNTTACSGGTCRQSDNEHMNDLGSAAKASLWQTALHASGSPF